MSRVSPAQAEFARRMTTRQWNTLRALSMCSFHMSATERGDPELYSLITNKLAEAFSPAPELFALFGWRATGAGKAAVALRDRGRL